MPTHRTKVLLAGRGLLLLGLFAPGGCKRIAPEESGRRILHLAARSKIGSMDPVQGGTQYASLAAAPVYESLFDYHYLKRPYALEPGLLESMPERSEDGLLYRFTLARGVHFHDDPCFVAQGGKGRELVAEDVIYSIKRMANRELAPRGWWIYSDRIVGLDAFKAAQDSRPAGAPFGADTPVEGLLALDRYRFEIRLLRPYPQLLYVLAMPFASVVPREAEKYYGPEFARHPVGTGPFRFKHWLGETEIAYSKNEHYRQTSFPTAEPGTLPVGFEALAAASGRRIPFLDGVVLHIYEQDQPAWLRFRVKDLDLIQVPAEYYDGMFDEAQSLRPRFREEGVKNYNLPLLDFVYRGFNQEDPVVGTGERGRLVRQAIAAASDLTEINDAFYNGTAIIYDGPIPPGLDGYEPGVLSRYRGPNLDLSRALLEKAGYPGGEGLPPIEFETSRTGGTVEQTEMFVRQLKKAGIRLTPSYNTFPQLNEKLRRRKAQMFGLAWGSDYPDAENNLALFYGPNSAPGSNNFNYRNAAYDRLYEEARILPPSPERTALYQKMRDLLIEDCPSINSLARTRYYAWNPRLKNVYPTEAWWRWIRYLDVEPRR